MTAKVRCPHCATIVGLDEQADAVVCPQCRNRLPALAAKPRSARPMSAEVDKNDDAPYGISGWALIPMILAALAVAQASLLGRSAYRSATIALALCGLISVVAAFQRSCRKRAANDRAWIGAGAMLNLTILLVVLQAPGFLNRWWDFNSPPRPTDPHGQVVVSYQNLQEEGRPAADGWADAETEAVRVGDDVVVRVEAAKTGRVPGMGDATYLQVWLRIANLSRVANIHFTGFAGEGVPILTDESGRSFALKKQRLRQRVSGPAVFADAPAGTFDININSRQNPNQDVLLVYELPPDLEGLRLQVPGAAFNKKCTCRVRIAKLFESLYPDKNE